MFKRKNDDLFFPHDPEELDSLAQEKPKNVSRLSSARFPARFFALLALFGLIAVTFVLPIVRTFLESSESQFSQIIASVDESTPAGQGGISGSRFSRAEWVITADQDWQSYGDLIVQAGDRLVIEVQGGEWSSKGGSSMFGAEGSTFTCRLITACSDPLFDVAQGALIARIGDGQPFRVGDEFDAVVDEDGLLTFRMNDATLSDNTGSLSLLIEVTGAA